MHGSTKDAPNLAFLGSYDVQFNWGNGGIPFWSKFFYKPAGGVVAIHWEGQHPEAATEVIRLLKASITSVESSQRGFILLGFSIGDQLEIFEDERYQSFSIADGKSPLIIVSPLPSNSTAARSSIKLDS